METKTEKKLNGKWYAIQTYSGYEKTAVQNLKNVVESLGLQDKIFEILVPLEKIVRIKAGKRIEKMEYIYPGYLLINMIVDDESWYAVRNTERVSGVVGSGTDPVPLSENEIKIIFDRMENDKTIKETDLVVGETVKIVEGPFATLDGKVVAVDINKGKVNLLISMFGQDTPVELDFMQIRKI